MAVGIESLSLYVPHAYLDMHVLAVGRGVDSNKYVHGIGQEKMAVPAPDEDVVTMGANAAWQAIQGVDVSTIDTLIFATESGIDQSKAASIYIHGLLGLPSSCSTFEVKQACYSATGALQMAMANVALRPQKRVLIIAADVARYGINATGEPTQGAGAIAMVVSATPRLVALDPEFGSYTEDVMDFWRPNYMDEALVDGKYSIKVYLRALEACWTNYLKEGGQPIGSFNHFCYHLPFTRMAEKAHLFLARLTLDNVDRVRVMETVEPSLKYNRIIGNCYTASLYVGLLSLLEQSPQDLTGKRIGLFSYGSGCVGSFFSGTVSAGYQAALQKQRHHDMLASRRELTLDEYAEFYTHQLPTDGSTYRTPRNQTGRYRLAGIEDHKRIYEAVETAAPASASPQAAETVS